MVNIDTGQETPTLFFFLPSKTSRREINAENIGVVSRFASSLFPVPANIHRDF